MTQMGKILFFLGLVLMLVGLAVWGMGRLGFRGLPGDIVYRSDNVRIYFPLATSILLSILLTALFWLWQWLSK